MNELLLRKYVELMNVRHEEEGAEGPEYLALVGAVIILLVLVGQAFKNDNGATFGEGLLGIFGKAIEVGVNWISKIL